MTGTDGIRSPCGSTTITFVCVATRTFGARRSTRGEAGIGRGERPLVDAQRGERAAGEAGRSLTPAHRPASRPVVTRAGPSARR